MKKTTDNHLLIFDLPHPNNGEKLISAELKVLTLVDQVGTGVRQAKLSVYDDVTKTLNYTQKIHFEHSSNTWLTFNVTLPVTNIFQNNKKYIKIILSISSLFSYSFNNLNALKLSLMPLNAALEDNVEHDYPVLILSYASSEKILKKTRKKRGLEEEYEEETNKVWDNEEMEQKYEKKLKKTKNMCKRRPLYINFSEIDFDLWIIQPTGYEAYQCQGKCFYPVAEHLNPTKHAIVQALLHNLAPSKASRSCCVPTVLDSISILYVDNNGILTYRYAYNDMVVLECGCR